MKCEFDYEVDELNLALGTRTRMTPQRLFINVPQYMMSRMTGYAYCSSCGMDLTTLTTYRHMGRRQRRPGVGKATGGERLIRRTASHRGR